MKNKISLAAVAALLSFQLSGCFPLLVGAAAGAGGMIWVTGKLEQQLNASVDRVHRASILALKKLELPILVDNKDKTTAKIESKYADGKHVWIDIEHVSKDLTKVAIRVGTLGDEVRSREILDNIMNRL
ncbi:MAG: DUF3568 family protein [Candidatus Omnitrophota bacterium]